MIDDLISDGILNEADEEKKFTDVINLAFSEIPGPVTSVNPFEPELQYEFHLCGSHGSSCGEGSAVCMEDRSKNISTNLGRFDSALQNKLHYYTHDSLNYILFKNGAQCSAQSLNKHSSVQINLICAQGSKETFAPQFLSFNQDTCRYLFEWSTRSACALKLDTNSTGENLNKIDFIQKCTVYSKLHNHTFDLSGKLDNNEIKGEKFTYELNVCGKDLKETSIIRIDDKGTKITMGYSTNMTMSHLNTHIILSYKGDSCSSGISSAISRETTILLECSPFSDLKPTIVYEDECSLTVQWATRAACLNSENSKLKNQVI